MQLLPVLIRCWVPNCPKGDTLAVVEVPIGWATVSGTAVTRAEPSTVSLLCPEHSRLTNDEVNAIARSMGS